MTRRRNRPRLQPVEPPRPPVEVPADPTSTAYPIFWETYAMEGHAIEFQDFHPNEPDHRMMQSGSNDGRTNVSVLQALRRNSPDRDAPTSAVVAKGPGYTEEQPALSRDDEPAAPGPSTEPAPLDSPQDDDGSSVTATALRRIRAALPEGDQPT